MLFTTSFFCVVAVWFAAEGVEVENVNKQEKIEQVKLLSPLSGCPHGNTQCAFGCCPLSSAVCCSDFVHCCPNEHRCDYSTDSCVKNMLFSPFMDKKMPQENAESAKLLPHLSECPPGMTQCGSGCCPVSSAVCCSDGVHCCPGGYRCDYSVGGCVRNMLFSPFTDNKIPQGSTELAKLLSPLSGCPHGNTQCAFGCCPLSSAVCCSDFVHCCPSEHRCDYSTDSCVKNMLFLPFMDKKMTEANTQPAKLLSNLSGCPPGNTQCGNGCCPLSSAVCCSDGIHCCPSRYRCDYSVGGCVRNMLFSPFLKKEKYLEMPQI